MADADLTQINGTQAFPATSDIGTGADEFLAPTDGKKITAFSNAVGQAPVGRALTRTKNLLLGLRAAIIGDFAGAAQKTLRSVYVKGPGAVTHTKAAGTITADRDIVSENGGLTVNHDIVTTAGNVQSQNGSVSAMSNVIAATGYVQASAGSVRAGIVAGEHCQVNNTNVEWNNTTTGAGGANPPHATPLANQFRAKLAPKFWGRIVTNTGVITTQEGCGGWTAALVDLGGGKTARYRLRITLDAAAALDGGSHGIFGNGYGNDGAGGFFLVSPQTDTMTGTNIDIALLAGGGGFVNVLTYPEIDVSFLVFGRQNT